MIVIEGERYEGVLYISLVGNAGLALGCDEKHGKYSVMFKANQIYEMRISNSDLDITAFFANAEKQK